MIFLLATLTYATLCAFWIDIYYQSDLVVP